MSADTMGATTDPTAIRDAAETLSRDALEALQL
jgi:hypothetical protein